ncbi:MAG: hypothetical protein F6K62_26450 [Sphaerospermopsis sp. SIO1G2]|nr:hypothetical protein [Sphaerospermopsis sp. SIO1G2]
MTHASSIFFDWTLMAVDITITGAIAVSNMDATEIPINASRMVKPWLNLNKYV